MTAPPTEPEPGSRPDGRATHRNAPVPAATIDRARELLTDPGMTLAEVARVLGVSRHTLRTRIPAEVRQSEERGRGSVPPATIARARELLDDPAMTLSEAARRVGVSRRTLAKYIPDRPRAHRSRVEECWVPPSWPDPGPGGPATAEAAWQGQNARTGWGRGR